MCGIAGKMYFDSARRVDEELLSRMCAALAHRGPDDEGIYSKAPVGLGHRRLSIIDLSAAGHQPMPNDDGTVWITFNGEIYNFLELRRELEREGWSFRSRTDTEVLLRLYEARGVDGLPALRGMFSFAIWDARRRTLLLVRDRLGVKPLYYRVSSSSIVFASELKSLLEDPEIERKVDPIAIHHYLSYQYVPTPHTVFRGVRKLPPAHYLLCRDGHVQLERYWKLSYLPKHEVQSDSQQRDLEHEIVQRLEEAVRYRLISDVPLGAFLSGGIDSSAVVALMSRIMDRPVKTFSIGFEEESYDELPHARRVAKLLGTDHTEYKLRADIVHELPGIVRAYDEPYGDASGIPTFLLSRHAREEVKVVLTGDAGDENFAGYDRHAAHDLAQRMGGIAALLGHKVARDMIHALPHGKGPRDFRWRLKRFVDQLGQSPELRNVGWMSHFSNGEKDRLYTEAFKRQVMTVDSGELLFARYRESGAEDPLDAILYSDITTYLPDCLLVKTDIASMANALEARSPFLDHPFVEFAARIPSSLKLHGGTSKWILKRALRGLLPAAILERPKMGFNLPLDEWLRGELRENAQDLLLSERSAARGYFNPDFVQHLFDEHLTRRWDWQRELWTLMMLEMWHREFVDRASDATVTAAREHSAFPYFGRPRLRSGPGSESPGTRPHTT